jgi:hypothetical protein
MLGSLRVLATFAVVATAVVGACVYLGLAAMRLAMAPSDASALKTYTLAKVSMGTEDWWWNWDFLGQSESSAAVDVPMRFVFANNAEIDLVKNRLDGCGGDPNISPTQCAYGGSMYQRLSDQAPSGNGNGTWWDSDKGIKHGYFCDYDNHMRLYARPSYDRMYSYSLSYYIVASVHLDFEFPYGCTNHYFAEEIEEQWWVNRINSHLWQYGWWANYGTSNWSNYEFGRWMDNTHYIQSDGYATQVNIYE